MDIQEFVSSLRELADWYEQHPTTPIPYDFKSPMLVFFHDYEGDPKDLLREIGSFEKVFKGDDFEALKRIGALTLRFHTTRDNVCTPRIVGKRFVAAKVVPAEFTPEQVIEAHEEDVIEWDCEPILKDAPVPQPVLEQSDILTDEEIPF